MYCIKCGAQIEDTAIACPRCGVPTKNYKKPSVAQTTVNVSARGRRETPPPAASEAWKFVLGLIVLSLGAYGFLQGWSTWSVGTLGLSIVAILGGAMLIAWGIVCAKTVSRAQKSADDEVRV